MDKVTKAEREARERLQSLARGAGASLAELSRVIGRNPAYLQQYVTRASPRHLDGADLRKIAEYLGASPRVIETRRLDDMPPDSPPGRRAVSAEDWVDVPRLALGASAGPGAFSAEEIPFDAYRFTRRWLREMGLDGADLTAIRVEGDSMEPMLRSGDEIFVDRNKRGGEGIFVVRVGEALHVKQVHLGTGSTVRMVSLNDAYPPVELPRDEVTVIGRVVWKGGRV